MKINTELVTLALSVVVFILVLTLITKQTNAHEKFQNNTVTTLPNIPVNNLPTNPYLETSNTINVYPNVQITGIEEYITDPNYQESMTQIFENLKNDNPCDIKSQMEINYNKMEELQEDMKELKESCGCKNGNSNKIN